MLNNMPENGTKENKIRMIMFIIIGVICAISIILAIVFQISQLSSPPEIIEPEVEITDFKTIFDNKLNEQGNIVKVQERFNDDKEIVYTINEQREKKDGKYEIDIKIPLININNPTTLSIDKEIESVFQDKAKNIMNSEQDYETIYTVEYTAYINSNILSLVIKSTLKEGIKAQRVIVKTYTYNMTTNEIIGIDDLISIKNLNKDFVQNEINRIVQENAKQSQSLIEL